MKTNWKPFKLSDLGIQQQDFLSKNDQKYIRGANGYGYGYECEYGTFECWICYCINNKGERISSDFMPCGCPEDIGEGIVIQCGTFGNFSCRRP